MRILQPAFNDGAQLAYREGSCLANRNKSCDFPGAKPMVITPIRVYNSDGTWVDKCMMMSPATLGNIMATGERSEAV